MLPITTELALPHVGPTEMSGAIEDPDPLDVAANRYQVCRTALTSENFISLIRAVIIRFNTAHRPEQDDTSSVTLRAQAWTCTSDLATAMKPAIDFYCTPLRATLESKQYGNT